MPIIKANVLTMEIKGENPVKLINESHLLGRLSQALDSDPEDLDTAMEEVEDMRAERNALKTQVDLGRRDYRATELARQDASARASGLASDLRTAQVDNVAAQAEIARLKRLVDQGALAFGETRRRALATVMGAPLHANWADLERCAADLLARLRFLTADLAAALERAKTAEASDHSQTVAEERIRSMMAEALGSAPWRDWDHLADLARELDAENDRLLDQVDQAREMTEDNDRLEEAVDTLEADLSDARADQAALARELERTRASNALAQEHGVQMRAAVGVQNGATFQQTRDAATFHRVQLAKALAERDQHLRDLVAARAARPVCGIAYGAGGAGGGSSVSYPQGQAGGGGGGGSFTRAYVVHYHEKGGAYTLPPPPSGAHWSSEGSTEGYIHLYRGTWALGWVNDKGEWFNYGNGAKGYTGLGTMAAGNALLADL